MSRMRPRGSIRLLSRPGRQVVNKTLEIRVWGDVLARVEWSEDGGGNVVSGRINGYNADPVSLGVIVRGLFNAIALVCDVVGSDELSLGDGSTLRILCIECKQGVENVIRSALGQLVTR